MRQPAAFFDVDGTLTTAATLFRFLEYRLAADGHPPQTYLDIRRHLAAMTAAGVPRAQAGRVYYAAYAGERVEKVAAQAEEWFRTEAELGGLFNPAALAALRTHQQAGDLIVFVSGSFAACLDPVARHLGADVVLCSQPETAHGRYTGQLRRPMIGDAKAAAVRELAATRSLDLSSSTSYGDHVSDLPVLCLAGRGAVVGGDPRMHAHACRHGWRILPGAAAPPPLPASRTGEPAR
ncbi:HAD family hydrolase [Streptomyces phaeochromogenes]